MIHSFVLPTDRGLDLVQLLQSFRSDNNHQLFPKTNRVFYPDTRRKEN